MHPPQLLSHVYKSTLTHETKCVQAFLFCPNNLSHSNSGEPQEYDYHTSCCSHQQFQQKICIVFLELWIDLNTVIPWKVNVFKSKVHILQFEKSTFLKALFPVHCFTPEIINCIPTAWLMVEKQILKANEIFIYVSGNRIVSYWDHSLRLELNMEFYSLYTLLIIRSKKKKKKNEKRYSLYSNYSLMPGSLGHKITLIAKGNIPNDVTNYKEKTKTRLLTESKIVDIFLCHAWWHYTDQPNLAFPTQQH